MVGEKERGKKFFPKKFSSKFFLAKIKNRAALSLTI
jgi:hypothetical protein